MDWSPGDNGLETIGPIETDWSRTGRPSGKDLGHQAERCQAHKLPNHRGILNVHSLALAIKMHTEIILYQGGVQAEHQKKSFGLVFGSVASLKKTGFGLVASLKRTGQRSETDWCDWSPGGNGLVTRR